MNAHPLDERPVAGLRLDAGPDAGRCIPVTGDPVVLGRAPGPGRIHDALLEAHHLVVDPARRAVLQLTGRFPACVDGVPVGTGRPIADGSVIEVGATRIAIVGPGAPHARALLPGAVLLGVGVRHDDPDGPDDVTSAAFTEQAEAMRRRTPSPVTLDVGAVRRVLVVGPPAERFAATLADRVARAGGVPPTVAAGTDVLTPPTCRLVIAHDPDPETAWPDPDLFDDAVVIEIGSSWHAVLARRAGDGSTALQRFHAAGDGAVGPARCGVPNPRPDATH